MDGRPSQGFSFVVITDLHLSLADPGFGPNGDATLWFDADGLHERAPSTPGQARELLTEITERFPDAAFVLNVGDATNRGTDEELNAYAAAVADCPLRVVTIPGNHDHAAIDPAQAVDDPASIDFAFERLIGPRFGSFDHQGVHFAWIDWTTWHLGVDDRQQRAWLHDDLGALPAGTPVILLTHDQMLGDFYAELPSVPIATFSGHWHTSRVVEVSGTRHDNCGPAIFGGLDYCPAQYRHCRWTGDNLDVEPIVRGRGTSAAATLYSTGSRDASVTWSAALSGAVHRAEPVVADGLVLATSQDQRTPGGWLEAFDAAAGERVWSVRLASAVKAAPVVAGGAAVAAAVTGETVCVDLATGAERWRVRIDDDPLRLWLHLRPATDGRRVFVGDTGRFGALDLADGSVAWMRDDLGVRENITCHAHPVVVGDLVLASFAAQVPDVWCLRAASGEVEWPADTEAASIYRLPGDGVAVHLPRSPAGALAVAGDDVLVVRLGSRVERVRAKTGEVVWSAPFRGFFNPAGAVLVDDAIIACEGMGTVWCFDVSDGERRWTTPITTSAPISMGPYRSSGGALFAPPTRAGGRLLVPTGDGRIVTIRMDGTELGSYDIGVPIVAALSTYRDTVIAAPVDGVLRALPLDRLLV